MFDFRSTQTLYHRWIDSAFIFYMTIFNSNIIPFTWLAWSVTAEHENCMQVQRLKFRLGWKTNAANDLVMTKQKNNNRMKMILIFVIAIAIFNSNFWLRRSDHNNLWYYYLNRKMYTVHICREQSSFIAVWVPLLFLSFKLLNFLNLLCYKL